MKKILQAWKWIIASDWNLHCEEKSSILLTIFLLRFLMTIKTGNARTHTESPFSVCLYVSSYSLPSLQSFSRWSSPHFLSLFFSILFPFPFTHANSFLIISTATSTRTHARQTQCVFFLGGGGRHSTVVGFTLRSRVRPHPGLGTYN